MSKIRITEKQAKLLGVKKLKEEEETATTRAALGPHLRRIVISGEPLKTEFIRKAVLSIILRHDKNSDAQYIEQVNKMVSKKTDEHAFGKIKRDLKSINTNINVEPKIEGKGGAIETLANGLVIDTALSSLKPTNAPSTLKITKEQYNRIFASGLINEAMDSTDKAFKKEFANSDIKNLGEESNFNIKDKNPSLPSSIQGKFGKPLMETDDELKNETRDLIKYFYRKSDQFSPFWDKHGLTYDDIHDALKSRGLVVTENGMCELSKKFGTPQEAIQAVEEELKKLIDDKQVMDEDGYLPAGAEYDTNAPWVDRDVTKPIKAKKNQLDVIAYNSEAAILKALDGSLYFFFFGHLNRDVFQPYAEVEKTFVGKDEEGEPEFDLSDEFDINDEVITNYVNDNLDSMSKGEGVDAWEDGVDLVKIDEPLKAELLKMYDKDKSFVKILSSLTEEEKRSVYDMMKKQIQQATEPKPKVPMTPERAMDMAKNLAKLYNKPVEFYLDKIKAEYGLDETTTASSSGAFTGPFNGPVVKREMPDVPVVGETTTAASSGQYTAPAFKMKNHTEFSNEKPKAFKKTQWAGGAMVDFDKDCVKLNNSKKAQKGGCSQGAVDNVVKFKKTSGNINAPSLNEALKLQINKEKNELIVISDLEGKAASQETFSNKNVLKQNGFRWNGTNWVISTDKLNVAKTTLSLINKAEYIINQLEDLEDAVDSSDSDKKSFLKSKLEMYINDLANATDEKALSAEIRRYLTFFSKFHDYSFYNRILIFIQKPDATRVASYKKWQEKHRQVKKGAKGISILAPLLGNKETKPDAEDDNPLKSDAKYLKGFRAVTVFDISDTEATSPEGEVPETPQWWGENTPSDVADKLFGYVSEVASDMGIKITASDASRGERGYAAGDHINISSGVEGVGRISTMIHEIAHELMHFRAKSLFYQDDGVRSSSALKELQAESVSYVVLKHYGLPVSHHTTYLALWKANKEKIQANLEVISKVAQFIIDKIDEEAERDEKEVVKPDTQTV